MLSEFLKAAQTEVDNHSIYVWGGSGQLCCEVSESWIRQREAGRQPGAAVKAWKEVEAGPYRDVARLFDCSGYVSWCLNKAGAYKGRTNCDGLFARCEETYTPVNGTLLFRVSPTNKNDETHVGIYFDGMQYHAKGRAVGVVCEPYNERYWQKLGWFRALKPDDPEPTPTTESADPYTETQICNDFGVEEFVDSRTVPMPVGANALYQANLRAKLEMAPDSPDGDGDYIVRQTDGLNEYVAVSSNSTISGLSTRCPACPTDTDGTFVLKATVSSGAVTYAWTAE